MSTNVWRVWGKWYGFPQCCVDAFCNFDRFKGPYGTSVGPRKLDGTGYIPCDECNTKYTEEELAANIQKSRRCPYSSPYEGRFIRSMKNLLASPDMSVEDKRAIAATYEDDLKVVALT